MRECGSRLMLASVHVRQVVVDLGTPHVSDRYATYVAVVEPCQRHRCYVCGCRSTTTLAPRMSATHLLHMHATYFAVVAPCRRHTCYTCMLLVPQTHISDICILHLRPWHCAGRRPRLHGRASRSQPRPCCHTSSAERTSQRPRPSQAPAKTTTKAKTTPRPAPPRAPPHACGRTGGAPGLTARKIREKGGTAGEGPPVYLCMHICRYVYIYVCIHAYIHMIRGTRGAAGEGPPVYLCRYMCRYTQRDW